MNAISKRVASLSIAVALGIGFMTPQMPLAKSGGENGIPGFTKELTAKQQDTLKKIWSENLAVRKSLRKALAVKRAELNEIMKSENPDKAKIESISREIGELRGKMLVEGAETHAKLAKAGLPVGEMKFRDRGGRYDKNNLAPHLNNNLTAEQKATAQKILEANAAARSEWNNSITAKRGELAELMKSPAPDRAKIEILSSEIGELRGKMLVDRIELRKELKKASLPANSFERGSKSTNMEKNKQKKRSD